MDHGTIANRYSDWMLALLVLYTASQVGQKTMGKLIYYTNGMKGEECTGPGSATDYACGCILVN